MKIKNKLEEENKIVRREYESRIIKQKKVNKKEMRSKVKNITKQKDNKNNYVFKERDQSKNKSCK